MEVTEELEPRPFTSLQSLRRRLNDRREALEKDTTRNQYLVFSNVSESIASNLSDDSCPVSKFARLSYNVTTEILLVKIMPRPEHEVASLAFLLCIEDEIRAMNLGDEIEAVGSATIQIGNWRKEADQSWAPPARDTRLSMILEIGLSESARKLAQDSRGWLETAGSTIQVVITMNIDRNRPQITVRHWELGPRLSTTVTCGSPQSAHCVNEITITRANTTTTVSGDLTLPFRKIVGRVRNPSSSERDFFIAQTKLERVAEKVWRKQRFI